MVRGGLAKRSPRDEILFLERHKPEMIPGRQGAHAQRPGARRLRVYP